MIRPLFHEYTPSETIAISSSGGTRSGSIAAYDGAPVAPAALARRIKRIKTAGVRTPTPRVTARAVVTSACAISAVAKTFRRSNRSASNPPTGEAMLCGANVARATNPVCTAEPVFAATRLPTTISWTQVPMSLTTAALHKSRTARWRRGTNGWLVTTRPQANDRPSRAKASSIGHSAHLCVGSSDPMPCVTRATIDCVRDHRPKCGRSSMALRTWRA